MWPLIATVIGCGLLLCLAFFARQDGKKSERLAALKREAKEIARAQGISDNVRRLSADSVRDRLKQTK